MLYKLFSRMLCGRLRGVIDRGQSVDQAACRRGFSTAGHLLCTTFLFEGSRGYNVELWVGM
eukprot:2298634-Pyramimonas_sp.AAC.1